MNPYDSPRTRDLRVQETTVSHSVVGEVVNVLLVLLIGLVVGGMYSLYHTRVHAHSYSEAAEITMEILEDSLETHRIDVGRFPTRDEGLDALVTRPPAVEDWDGPYLNSEVPLDPWGLPYEFDSRKKGGYSLRSLGPDRMRGTEDDIVRSQFRQDLEAPS